MYGVWFFCGFVCMVCVRLWVGCVGVFGCFRLLLGSGGWGFLYRVFELVCFMILCVSVFFW